MKTIIKLSILSLFFLVISCDENDGISFGKDEIADDTIDNTGPTNELNLKSYQLEFKAGNTETHDFENNLETTVTKDAVLETTITYDNNFIKSFNKLADDGTVLESTIFNYDSDNKLISLDETGVHNGLSSTETYNRKLTYSNNKVSYKIPTPFFAGFRDISIELNDEGLIERFKQKNLTTNILEANYGFTYDDNGNCTNIDLKNNIANIDTQRFHNNSFDSKVNPLYKHFKANYLAFLIMTNDASILGGDISSTVRTMGKNNLLKTFELSSTYEYNSDNYPTSATAKSLGGLLLFSNTFEYE